MARLPVELITGERISVLYEDRSVLALDKPAGWMLAPESWDRTGRNLQLALMAAVKRRDPWVQARQLRFIRYVHRLDAETSGVLLMVKSLGAVHAYSELFRGRSVEKVYLAVVRGTVKKDEWVCSLPLGRNPRRTGAMHVDRKEGELAETHFRTIAAGRMCSLVEARPVTGRTHQIRVHLAESGYPIVGDRLYSDRDEVKIPELYPLGLRAVLLAYRDPFQRRPVRVVAPTDSFVSSFGFPRNAWVADSAHRD